MKKGDIALIIVAAAFLILWLLPREDGNTVIISVDGEIYKKLPLAEDNRISVENEYGKNTVVIENGCVYIENADCPDKICEKEKISESGRSIVCLPNRLSVQIEGEKQKEEIDVIV